MKELTIGSIYLMDRETDKRVQDGLNNRPFKVLQKLKNNIYLCESLSYPSLLGIASKYKQCFWASDAIKEFTSEHDAVNWCVTHPISIDKRMKVAM